MDVSRSRIGTEAHGTGTWPRDRFAPTGHWAAVATVRSLGHYAPPPAPPRPAHPSHTPLGAPHASACQKVLVLKIKPSGDLSLAEASTFVEDGRAKRQDRGGQPYSTHSRANIATHISLTRTLTVALEALAEQPVEQRAAVVAEGRGHEVVAPEAVRHVNLEPLPQVLQHIAQ